jgi:hypothetical protein
MLAKHGSQFLSRNVQLPLYSQIGAHGLLARMNRRLSTERVIH